MAKKTKRKVSTGMVPAAAPDEMEAAHLETPVRATVTNRRVMSSTEFNPDYSYVISDLKRIGMLAGVFFVILIGLSFIL